MSSSLYHGASPSSSGLSSILNRTFGQLLRIAERRLSLNRKIWGCLGLGLRLKVSISLCASGRICFPIPSIMRRWVSRMRCCAVLRLGGTLWASLGAPAVAADLLASLVGSLPARRSPVSIVGARPPRNRVSGLCMSRASSLDPVPPSAPGATREPVSIVGARPPRNRAARACMSGASSLGVVPPSAPGARRAPVSIVGARPPRNRVARPPVSRASCDSVPPPAPWARRASVSSVGARPPRNSAARCRARRVSSNAYPPWLDGGGMRGRDDDFGNRKLIVSSSDQARKTRGPNGPRVDRAHSPILYSNYRQVYKLCKRKVSPEQKFFAEPPQRADASAGSAPRRSSYNHIAAVL